MRLWHQSRMKYMEGLKPQQMSDWLYKSLLMLQACKRLMNPTFPAGN
ncbi:hypothetical protein BV349_05220 [Pseudomonas syringae pv. actinidiae]|nr:hypothetical protein BV349_05220 [Pseudomonas syringae pv. actinidiae]OSN70358.1 hypothetical protein BV351_05178 [Pseudomonas syringae pv. actinidiae]